MNMARIFHSQRRAILLAAVALALGGIVGWTQMPKQEDPRFPDRFGNITVTFPGATAETVERLVVLPLERELAEISRVETVQARAGSDVAVVIVELAETVYETDPVWDDVDAAVARAEADFPDGVGSVTTDYEVTDLESVTFALTGSRDWNTLMAAATRLEDRLLRLDGVKRTERTPDFDTQVIVELAAEQAQAVGVSARDVARSIEQHTVVVPGGAARLASREVAVDSGTDFASLEELRRLSVPLPDGRVLPLTSLATVRHGPAEPVQEHVRYNGERALIVGVVPQAETDLIEFGRELESELGALEAAVAPLSLERLTYQPVRVERRLADLQFSLLQGMLIVATVVMVALGRRVGGVVAAFVPLVSLAALLVYYVAGGVLHQITIAALVVSLGLLVDNAIVVSERIQWHIDTGRSPIDAAGLSVRELALPLAAATGTTLASFIPLLLSRGVSADFTRAIPQVVMLTLSVSFAFALTVIPTAGTVLFRPGGNPAAAGSPLLRRLSQLPARRPWRILAAAALLVVASTALLPFVRLQFFPGSDRNQLVLEMELPAGSTAEATSEAAWTLEQELLRDGQISDVAAFVGRSTPAFYYNLVGRSNAPNFAQLLVTTRSEADVPQVAARARRIADRRLPGISFVARPLEQGPPAAAPVEIRLYGEDRAELADGVRTVFEAVKKTAGTRDVRHDMDLGTLSLRVRVNEAIALSRYIAEPEAALAVLSQTRGIPAGEYRGGDDPADIVVRSPGGRDTAMASLSGTPIRAGDGRYVPLAALAETGLEMRPATINRRDGRNVASVYAELAPGVGYNEVLAAVEPRLGDILPDGVNYEIGGVAESSGEANSAILEASYLGAGVLIFILVLQFRSFMLVGLVLLTVPLAAVGVIPGLFIFNRPFGFTSMLGAISLIGIVVNNAIILLDTVENRRRTGSGLESALRDAVLERMRPILLTVLTTVLALVPLLFSSSSLWPPFASALISGLLASTVMTLLVVPAAYFLMFRRAEEARSS